jgi:hypothetical protein
LSEPERELRYEVKFVAPPTKRSEVEAWIRTHPSSFRMAYPPRRVNNVYFDDCDLSTYEENLTGISRRMKIRFRWYGTDPTEPQGTLEFKMKRNRLGWKENFPVVGLKLAGRPWGEIVRSLRAQLPLEGRVWFDRYPQPILINYYWRHYFVSHDGRVRVTFDDDQMVCDQRFHDVPNFSSCVNLPDAMIVEVKAAAEDLELAGRAIQRIPIRVGRHSKYVVGVQSMMSEG